MQDVCELAASIASLKFSEANFLKQGVVWSLSAHVRWPPCCFPSWKQVDKLRPGGTGEKSSDSSDTGLGMSDMFP